MTTASVMSVSGTNPRHPAVTAHSVGRDAGLVLGGMLWLSLMVYLFLAVTASWASGSTATGPQASPAPAPIVRVAPVNADPILVPVQPRPGFLPR